MIILLAEANVLYAEPVVEKAAGGSTVEQDKGRSGLYMGLGLGASGIQYSEPNLNLNFDGAMFILKLGYDFNEYLGAEFRIGGTGADAQPVGASSVEMGAGFGSIFLKPQLPINQDFRVYALAGMTNAAFNRKQTVGGVVVLDDTVTKNGFSYGVGAEYDISDNISFGLEWVQYWTDIEVRPSMKATIWGAVGNFNYYF